MPSPALSTDTASQYAYRPASGASRLSPLVLLPGLLCDQSLWRPQIDALADRVAPVVADLTLDDNVADMARRILASAPASFDLVALSMGGYVALEIMRQEPERVRRLALIDTSARPDTAERADRRRAGIASLQHGTFRGVTQPLMSELVHASKTEGPVAESLKAMAARVGGPAFVRQQTAILTRPDGRPFLSEIHVPTLIAVGDEDRITPPDVAREMRDAIPGARLHVFDRCGHLPALEQPEETSALLRRWLADA